MNRRVFSALISAVFLSVTPSVDSSEPRRLGPDLHPPSIRRKVEPEYSQEARDARREGTVLVDAVIAKDGSVRHTTIRRGLGLGLDEKALEAVSLWQFEPARLKKDNSAIEVQVTIEINFRLQ